MIEDVKERLLRLDLPDEALNIIDDEYVHLLVEVHEHATLWSTHHAVTYELCFKLRARYVADTQGWVQLHGALSDGLREVGLPYTTGAVDEDEVQRCLPRTCSGGLGDAQGFAVTRTLIEGLEAEICAEV